MSFPRLEAFQCLPPSDWVRTHYGELKLDRGVVRDSRGGRRQSGNPLRAT